MKKVILLVAMFLSSASPAMAWESTLGLGWEHRHFSQDDQLGATSPTSSLRPTSSNGLRVTGSWLRPTVYGVEAGPEFSVGNSWLAVPHQSNYYTKTAGKIDTSALTTQSVVISAKIRVLDWRRHLLFLKPGFLVTNLTSGTDRVDADTGSVLGIEIASEKGDDVRASVDVQAILSPTARGKHEYDLSFGLVLSLQRVFRGKPETVVSQPVKVEPPKVVAVEQPKSESVKTPEPVKLAAPATPVTPPVTKEPEAQKVKATLKLDANGKLSPESYPLIQKVIDTYRAKPSTIRVLHRKDESSAWLAEEIRQWVVSKGVPVGDVQLDPTANLDKPIRINIVPR